MRRPAAFIAGYMGLVAQSAWLALGQIWANKSRSFLTMLGVIIGVASVVAVIAALTGLKAKIVSKFETVVGSNNIFMFPERPDRGRFHRGAWHVIRFRPEQFEGLLQHCPSVSRFTRICESRTTVRCREYVIEDVGVRGIESSWHAIQGRKVLVGRPFSPVDEEQALQVCLVTEDVRDKLHLDRDPTGARIVVGRRSFRVIGVIEKAPQFGGREGRSEREVIIPFATGWKFKWPWMWAIASSKSAATAEEATAEVRFFLRRMRHLKPGDPDTFHLEVMERHLKEIQNVALIMTAVAGGIVGISLLVGGIGIMNIMLVSVSERTREIGLRKAVGARPGTILLQFLVEAVVLCLCGGCLGLLGAEALTKGITSIPNAELEMAYIPLWAIGMAFGFSAFVGICFGMFPAIKAARLDPIEALRHE
ncbi:MAG TPA: ABC transporter permease [Planctomycetota bacterium]|jgi:putative ABC transport system permease protein|nr:ABC transporter permease [Planctomycetota bacterium]OQC21891.1 MAG: Macrolide export ATP-binding/permease protein MacB [Planctomycetes bacterium ADurb.Bin069]NMD36258.1 FtsX-like permease family protein [Planctomycetota bacterium]HOE29576.1 ABC transporter permease [Planctomycetota bacterium]HOE86221.1 ABC transporter permease [Planctomycetota bacterium]